MHRELQLTNDGSHTIAIPEMGVTYHSTFGAVRESKHVFIEAGFNYFLDTATPAGRLHIFEMGFGTGLNALLTLIESEKNNQAVLYETVELFPLEMEFIQTLNFCQMLGRPDLEDIFLALHSCEWNKEIVINELFTIKKANTTLLDFSTEEPIQLVYFDAFDPVTQPELWTEEIFGKIFRMMQPGSVLVTYSSKSLVRKAMRAVGYSVKKIPGPPGKWEIVRAEKK